MKISSVFAVAAAFLLAGCVSETRSYDANGNLLGRCESERSFFLGNGGAVCTGSSNPKDQGIPPSGPGQRPPSIGPGESGKCPEGQVFQYGECYPMNPIIGKPKSP